MHSRNGLNQCTASLPQLGKIKHGSVDFSIKGVNRQSAELFLSHRQTFNICKNRKAAILATFKGTCHDRDIYDLSS